MYVCVYMQAAEAALIWFQTARHPHESMLTPQLQATSPYFGQIQSNCTLTISYFCLLGSSAHCG